MNNALNLQEINYEEAVFLSKFFIRSQQNLFLFGTKGLGKTSIAIQAAEACKYKVNYINLSVIERADLAGYPSLMTDSDIVTFKSPAFLPLLKDNAKPNSVLLFDEVDKAPPEITAPLLEILQFKRINGKPINVVSCILTGNLVSERTYSNAISSALLDRGSKYILTFDFNQWSDWAKAHNVHDLVLGFLRSNPELACGKIEDSCYASPTPRGWTLASEAIIKARDLKIVDLDSITQIVSGFVGSEAGLKFKAWYEHYRKFEPFVHSLIEMGNMNFNFDALIPTEKLIFVISACHFAKHKIFAEPLKSKERLIYLENLCRFLTAYQVDHEIQVMGFYNSFDFTQITKYKLYECKTFFDHFNKLTEGVSFKK